MRAKAFEKFFKLVRTIERATKQAKEIRIGESLFESLETAVDPDTNQSMLESVRTIVVDIHAWSEDLLQRLSDRKPASVAISVSENQLKAAQLLREINSLLSSDEHGPALDKKLQDKTKEYVEFRKCLKTQSDIAMAHKLSKEME